MLRWVESFSYRGLSRRKAGRFRLFDRRHEDLSGAPGSLATLVRRLRVHGITSGEPESRQQFIDRLVSVAELADYHGEPQCRVALAELRVALDNASADAVLDDLINAALDRAATAIRG